MFGIMVALFFVGYCSGATFCPLHEVYKTCGTPCPATCENTNRVCNDLCMAGCFCQEGYVRSTKDFTCVPLTSCPTELKVQDTIGCGTNEVYTSCGSRCPVTCDNSSPVCTESCVGVCVCKAGYIRKTYGGTCINSMFCPSTYDPNQTGPALKLKNARRY